MDSLPDRSFSRNPETFQASFPARRVLPHGFPAWNSRSSMGACSFREGQVPGVSTKWLSGTKRSDQSLGDPNGHMGQAHGRGLNSGMLVPGNLGNLMIGILRRMLTWIHFTKKLCQIWDLAIPRRRACSLQWSMSFSEARFLDQDRFWLAWILLATTVQRRRMHGWSGRLTCHDWDTATTTSPENSYMASTRGRTSKHSAMTCGMIDFVPQM